MMVVKKPANYHSGVNIERIEIWITNKTSSYEQARNIVAFTDLAENSSHIFNTIPEFQPAPGDVRYPDNKTNRLYEQVVTTYSAMRNVDQIKNVFTPLYPSFQIDGIMRKLKCETA